MRTAHAKAAAVLLTGALSALFGEDVSGADSETRLELGSAVSDRPVEVRAENLEYEADTGWVVASGDVRIESDDQVMRADRVRLNQRTGEVEASGNVVFERGPGDVWRGDSLKYNFQTGEGQTSESHIESGVFKIDSDRIDRRPDRRIVLHDATLTSCTNAPGHEHYRVRGRKVTLMPGEYVKVRGATLRLFGLPAFYWPYWYRDLNEGYGLDLEPGYSSPMGAFLLGSYTARWFDFGPDAYLDGRTRFDLRSKRGVAGGQDLLWFSPRRGEGLLSLYYADDQEPPAGDETAGLPVDPERYRLHVEHSADIGNATRLMLQATHLSDTRMERDFFEDEYRRRREPDNYLAITHSGEGFMSGVTLRLGLNDFYNHVDRLPEFWLDTLSREVFSTGLYYENSSRAGWLRRRWADRIEAEDYDAFRADTEHVLSYPSKQFGFLSFVPRVGGRLTYYSDTLSSTYTSLPGRVETNALGQTVIGEGRRVRVSESAGSDLRSILEFGAEVSFRAYRSFLKPDGSAWRHIVEPYADYTLRPEPNLTPDQLYDFDAIDELDEQHDIAFGVRNYLQSRRNGRVRNVLDVDLYSRYRFVYPDNEDPLDRVFLDAILRPTDWLDIRSDSEYSVSDSEMKRIDTRLYLRADPVWTLDASHFYRSDFNNLLASGVSYAPNREWEFYLYGRYEEETSELEEVGSYVQYQWDCLALRVIGSFMPGYTDAFGVKESDEFRIRVNLWLTDFPPSNLNKRYRH